MQTFANKILSFNQQLDFDGKLPDGIQIMNPYKENKAILPLSNQFYQKFYNDQEKRHLILGINPGRFGGGVTGIAFTDPKRLLNECGIAYAGPSLHEPSSVFVYDVINVFGGAQKFYANFYINSICPLGFIRPGKNGKMINYNYYDTPELTKAVYSFIVKSIRQLIQLGVYTDTCICLGTGKNEKFLKKLNEEYQFFESIIAVEHPRYIMQYKNRSKDFYVGKYLSVLQEVMK